MKNRVIALLLAVLLLAALPFGAAAEKVPDFRAIQEAGEQPDASALLVLEPTSNVTIQGLVHSGQYFAYRNPKTECYGLCDAFGTIYWELPSSGKMFAKIFPNGYTMVQNDLYDRKGKKVNKDKIYADLTPMTDVVTGEQKFLGAQKTTKKGVNLYRDFLVGYDGSVRGLNEYGDAYNGKIAYQDSATKKWGVQKLDGTVVLAPSYEFLAFLNKDTLLCQKNGKYGAIRLDGTQVFECKYTDFTRQGLTDKNRVIVQNSSGKWGVINFYGSQVVPFQYDSIMPISEKSGYSAAVTERFDYCVHVSEMQYMSYYTEKDAWAYCGSKEVPEFVSPAGVYWSVMGSDGTRQLVDNQGKPVITGTCAGIEAGENGYLLKDFGGTGKSRFYDPSLKLVWEKTGTDCRLVCDTVMFNKANADGSTRLEIYSLSGSLVKSLKNADVAVVNRCGCAVRQNEEFAVMNHDGTRWTEFSYNLVYSLDTEHAENSVTNIFICALPGMSGVLFDTAAWKYPLGEEIRVWVQQYGPGQYGACTSADGSKTGVFYVKKPGDGPFLDTPASAWYAGAVSFCANAGLMNGTGHGSFSPTAKMTRAMLVQVLYNISGEKVSSCGFTDVPDGKWYSDAVNWAAQKGIVNGVTATEFRPNASVTREQMVTILQRYAQLYSSASGNVSVLNAYTDAGDISSYAREAMAWAVENGIITGKTATTLVPKGLATRAEIATVLMRFVNLMATP